MCDIFNALLVLKKVDHGAKADFEEVDRLTWLVNTNKLSHSAFQLKVFEQQSRADIFVITIGFCRVHSPDHK